jgi:hypothetical protein
LDWAENGITKIDYHQYPARETLPLFLLVTCYLDTLSICLLIFRCTVHLARKAFLVVFTQGVGFDLGPNSVLVLVFERVWVGLGSGSVARLLLLGF